MATWCTEGVKEDFARKNRRNAYFNACDREEKVRKKNKKLKAENKKIQELLDSAIAELKVKNE